MQHREPACYHTAPQWPHKTGYHTDLGVCFAPRPAIFEIQGCWKLEIHHMAPELLEAFNLTSILYTLNTHPLGPNITLFRSMRSHFRNTRLSKIRNAPKWPQTGLKHSTVESILYTLNTHTPRPKFQSVSFFDKLFSRYKVAENRTRTEWPQNDLHHLTVKSILYTHHEAQISLRFSSTVARFPDNWGLWFSHRVQWWISKLR